MAVTTLVPGAAGGTGVERVVDSSWQDSLCTYSVQERLQLGGCLLPGSKPEAPEGKAGGRAAGCRLRSRAVLGYVGTRPTCSFIFYHFLRALRLGFQPASLRLAPEQREREKARAGARVSREDGGESSTLASFSFSWELEPRQLSQLPPRAPFSEQDYCFSPSQSASVLRLWARKVKLGIVEVS